jgi:hypothetical protein
MVSGQSLTAFRNNLTPSGAARIFTSSHQFFLVRSPIEPRPAMPQGHRNEAGSSRHVGADVRSRSLKGERMRTRNRQDLGEGRDDVLKLSSAETRV